MRHARSAVAVLAFILGAAALPQAAAAQLGFSVGGGPSFPLSSLGDLADMGWNAQVSASLSIPLLPLGIRVDGLLNRFPEKEHDHNIQVVGGTANLVFNIPSVGITPYLIGGVGYYAIDSEDEGDSSEVGANIGVGVRLGLPGIIGVFGEARLHNLFNEGDAVRFAPLTFGIRL